jgi:hypothetical protein
MNGYRYTRSCVAYRGMAGPSRLMSIGAHLFDRGPIVSRGNRRSPHSKKTHARMHSFISVRPNAGFCGKGSCKLTVNGGAQSAP